ncbi:LemA family protein [Marinagarivorans cellulosilyticus]|uniref:LemA protein n=1 Tax=Marinagarivorans cellulosilyticus TaxID=2721545 RepID=A0AAN2BLR7_9GAMM|nr:LemA family protein [Marinagarivorans cellulosilyticus]BCD99315.1 LemA protein [Marinagarivorans cellulosilyticus]
MGTSGLITLGVVVIFALYVIYLYNQLVKLKNQFENGFSQIEVQLKRRYDLIPNLVETAKAYLKHESETLEAVVKARNAAASELSAAGKNPGDGSHIHALAGAEQILGQAMGRFNMVMEAYPDLKASTNMQQLTEELSSTENRVSFARQAFNDAVMAYNIFRESFPTVIFASMFGHNQKAALLEFEDSAAIAEAPKVSF